MSACLATPDTKTSCRMPRFWVYQFLEAAMDFTVRTRWSRAITVAARAGRAILDFLVEAGGR